MTDKEKIIDGVDVICENCGKQFKKKLYEYKRNKHHFWSPDCYHNFRIKPNEIIVYSDYAEIVIGDKAALIDIGDVAFCKKHNWRISNKGYVTTTINKKSKHLHRLIMSPMPQEEIDHINRDKLDNRKENLRICDRLTNMQNRGVNKNSSTLNVKTQECEGLKRKVELMMDCADCKVDEYKKALEEIEGIAKNFGSYAAWQEQRINKILDIINKAKEKED